MTTVNELISQAFRDLNAISETEDLTASQASYGLQKLNQIIDSWNSQEILSYFKSQNTFNLVDGQQSYTIGSGGDFDMTRPVKINTAFVTDGDVDFPLVELNYQEWSEIYSKNDESDIPYGFYYQPDFPLGKIYLYYTPGDSTNTITLFTENQLTSYTSLATVLSLPQGYERSLVYNLEAELLPRHGTEADKPYILKLASNSKEELQRLNIHTMISQLQTDPRLIGQSISSDDLFNSPY